MSVSDFTDVRHLAESQDSWTDIASSRGDEGISTPHSFADVPTPNKFDQQHPRAIGHGFDLCSFTGRGVKTPSEFDQVSSHSDMSHPASHVSTPKTKRAIACMQLAVIPRAPFLRMESDIARAAYERLLRTMMQSGEMPKPAVARNTPQTRQLIAAIMQPQRGALCQPHGRAAQRMPSAVALRQEYQIFAIQRHARALRPRHGADPAQQYNHRRHNALQHHHYGHHTEMRRKAHPNSGFDAKSMKAFARERSQRNN